MNKFKGIYGISDENLTPYDKIFEMLEVASKSGMKIFQLRDKHHRDNEIFQLCTEIKDFCNQNNIVFIINDRVDLAFRVNPEGLHIGADDGCLKEVKKYFEGKVGVSCYDSLKLAIKAQNEGADYVAFGAFFQSQTKPQAKKASLKLLIQAKQVIKIPICAIGGINHQNIIQLKEADMIAIVSGIWKGNIAENMKLLKKNWQG
ncbi:thiamine phosphate synthase [Helicobacter sp. 13S00477-4]|uniref:thiamine phosphate synthase n=1 Tax=Helicobacter sp. 13S00477-4 TaxID=1905759 RepID=UPI000BA5BF63|nr:thiamine phosphate synthase [Helicobacter sp. 13S00477-4]PAF50604.1 thiamine-phosphate diphosphorylase [Helicobacter sp. 13S00477-4]